MSADITSTDRFFAALTAFTAARVITPLTDEQRAMLRQDLPRSEVRTRAQSGQTLSYVDGAYVIERLNTVFGFDGWSSSYGAPTIIQGERPVVYVQVTLRAAGIERGDVGVGLASKNTGDALETAIKAAFTDALKRAARTLGASLGLALYDKEQATVGYSFAAQDVITAFDDARDIDAHKDAEEKARAVYKTLPKDEQTAIADAQLRSARRVDPNATPKPAVQPAAPPPVAPADAARAAFSKATSLDALEAAIKTHSPVIASLHESDRAPLRDLIKRQREFLTLCRDAGRATSLEALKEVHGRLAEASRAARLTREQVESVTETLNERLAATQEAA